VQHGFHAENILERISILIYRSQRTNRCTDDDARILHKIDSDITAILLDSERKCKTAKGHAWSPLLANAGRTVIAAKWHLSDLLTNRIAMSLWNRAESIIAAKEQVREAYATLRKVQKHAQQIRATFLDDRAEHLADTRQIPKAMALKQLIRAERQSSIFK
jgi:peroxiredoxin